MNTQSIQTLNGIYQLNSNLTPQQLYDAVNACLCKAEALAATAANTDFETYSAETIGNYMWVLSDIIREARWLYGKATPCQNQDMVGE